MPNEAGTIGLGFRLQINDGGGSSYAEVDAIVTIGIPSYTLSTVDSKRLSRDVVKVIAGIKRGDPFTIGMENTRAGRLRFRTLFNAKEEKLFRFFIPDDEGEEEYTVPGLITNLKGDVVVDEITPLEVTVQVSDEEQ
jgi:hypothetical protein